MFENNGKVLNNEKYIKVIQEGNSAMLDMFDKIAQNVTSAQNNPVAQDNH